MAHAGTLGLGSNASSSLSGLTTDLTVSYMRVECGTNPTDGAPLVPPIVLTDEIERTCQKKGFTPEEIRRYVSQ